MSAQGVFKITEEFERLLCQYTGAPYAVAVDNCSNALFLALVRFSMRDQLVPYTLLIPSHTYPSVPCEIIHAGFAVQFDDYHPALTRYADGRTHLTGKYQLYPAPVWDCALRFTAGMYVEGQTQCLSFTGPYKHLKLSKGGAILTDSKEDYEWYKRARFSGRRECSYHEDDFDMLGWNFYMMPELATRGVLLMTDFIRDGVDMKKNADLSLPFPDLSKFDVYRS